MSIETRASKQWWVVHNHSTALRTGWSCAPSNPDCWWFPDIGYTVSENHHLFSTEKQATLKALGELQAQINIEQIQADKLTERLKAL